MISDCNIGRLNNDLNQGQYAYVSKCSLKVGLHYQS